MPANPSVPAPAALFQQLSLAALLLACPLAVIASAAPTLEVLATDPAVPRVLATGEALYAQIRYQSDEPVRFQIRGYHRGEEQREGSRTNPAPPYPAGQGEAVVWLDYAAFTELDELRIVAADSEWKHLNEVTVPVDMEWSPGASVPRPRAAWVTRLNDEQQRRVSAAATASASDSAGDGFGGMLLMFMGWSVLGYLVLQVLLLRRWQGGWRTAARLPLLAAIPILAYTLFALAAGSNLWPLVMLFTFPFAFLYLLVLLVVKWLSGRRK